MKLFLGFMFGAIVLGLALRHKSQAAVSFLLLLVVFGVSLGYFFFNQI